MCKGNEKCIILISGRWMGNKDTISEPPPSQEPENVVYVPNVFSPNNDGKNDKFYVHGENISQFNIKIYNRWGEPVFETDNIHEGWNGRYKDVGCPEGVYFYIAELSFTDGSSTVKKGSITLVR
jgi:large repetitive protein